MQRGSRFCENPVGCSPRAVGVRVHEIVEASVGPSEFSIEMGSVNHRRGEPRVRVQPCRAMRSRCRDVVKTKLEGRIETGLQASRFMHSKAVSTFGRPYPDFGQVQRQSPRQIEENHRPRLRSKWTKRCCAALDWDDNSVRAPEVMGATREDVRGVILARATFLNLTGTVIGMMGALAFASLVESVLYENTQSQRHPVIRVGGFMTGSQM